MEHCGICQEPLEKDLNLSLTQTAASTPSGTLDETVEERFRLLLCRACWSTIDDEHSASGKHFRGLLTRPG